MSRIENELREERVQLIVLHERLFRQPEQLEHERQLLLQSKKNNYSNSNVKMSKSNSNSKCQLHFQQVFNNNNNNNNNYITCRRK